MSLSFLILYSSNEGKFMNFNYSNFLGIYINKSLLIKLKYLIFSFIFFLINLVISSSQELPLMDNEIHLGVASCAGSTCHGAISPLPGSNVLQNEYITWKEKDKHSRAYKVLLNDRSKLIAKNLGIKAPHTSELCLNCHADNIKKEKRHSTFKISDGVTCEACHGGAGKWIGTHITPTASHKNNLKNGLFPTADPKSRAAMCLSCHFGDKNRSITHRIMGAGHPRMSFELDTFTALEPAHFVVDKDYIKRGKAAANSVKVWSIGQAMALGLMLDVLVDPSRGMDGFFPELIVFDCHSCHSPMNKLQWAKREATGKLGPGIPKFNDSNLLMLQVIAVQVNPKLGSELKSATIRLHESMRKNRTEMILAAQSLKKLTNLLIIDFERYEFNISDMKKMISLIVNNANKGEYVDYAGAEQAYMAIGSIINGMNDLGALKKKEMSNINSGLDKINLSLENSDLYEPKVFITSLKEFNQLIN